MGPLSEEHWVANTRAEEVVGAAESDPQQNSARPSRQFHSGRERPGKADGMAAAVTTFGTLPRRPRLLSNPHPRSDLRDVFAIMQTCAYMGFITDNYPNGRQWLREATALPPHGRRAVWINLLMHRITFWHLSVRMNWRRSCHISRL